MPRKILGLLVLYAAALLAASAAFGEVERTLRAEIPDAARSPFVVENLVGRMRVVAGGGASTAVVATVHAADDALADTVRLERLSGEGGAAVLHVRYPEGRGTLRYRDRRLDSSWNFSQFSSDEEHEYQGRTFRVSRSRGKLLYVDLEVRLPATVSDARLRDLAGEIEADGLRGKLAFDVESADLRLSRVDGEISLHGTSGDIHASDIGGSWSSHFTSGDCQLRGFRGESFSFEATSGDLHALHFEAARARLHTNSGDVRLEDADIQDLDARATSGDIEVDQKSARLARAGLEASSGDVLLRLPRDASFRLDSRVSSGNVHVGFRDAVSEGNDPNARVYRRGNGGAQIRVRTSSGDIIVRAR